MNADGRDRVRRASTGAAADVAEGTCGCGCGGRTKIARQSRTDRGWVKGRPKRYLPGHNRALRPVPKALYAIEDRGYETPCWVWQRTKASGRYGHLSVGGRMVLAHRHFYEERVGPIPDGLQLDHLCRVIACVNPEHVEPVTGTENMRRAKSTKLCVEDAEAIRVEHGRGDVTQRELAARYGVTPSVVSDILRGKRWVVEEAVAR